MDARRAILSCFGSLSVGEDGGGKKNRGRAILFLQSLSVTLIMRFEAGGTQLQNAVLFVAAVSGLHPETRHEPDGARTT